MKQFLLLLSLFLTLESSVWAQTGKAKTKIPQATLDGLSEKRNVTYASYGDRSLQMDVFRPKSAWGKLPAIVCIHGGGWKKGGRSSHEKMAQALAARGYVAATISYRLSGEAMFPAAIHDCKAAVRYLRANADELGVDSDHIGAMGLSAGGHLTALLAISGGVTELEGNGGNADFSSSVQAAIPMGVPADAMSEHVNEASANPDRGQNWRMFLGGTQQEKLELYKLASADYHLDKDDPPCWFIAGSNDGKNSRAEAYRKRLTELGIETGFTSLEGGPHAFLGKQVWFDEMIDVAGAFFDKHLKGIQQPTAPAPKDPELSVLVVRGGHAYDTPAFENMCQALPGVNCDLVLTAHFERMKAEQIDAKYDAILFLNQNKKYTTANWHRKRYMELAELGTGMVFLQFTLSSEPEWDEYHDLVGGKWYLKQFEKNEALHSTYFTNMTLDIKVADPDHPTTKGIDDFELTDAYYGNIFISPDVTPLLECDHKDVSRTIAWTHQYKNSKVVYVMPGFTEKAYKNRSYQKFLGNSIEFVAKE